MSALPILPEPLADRHGRRFGSLRIGVTAACDFRCVYCLPADYRTFVHGPELLTYGEIARVAAVAVRLGMSRIRLTGGEPLVRPRLPELVGRLAAPAGVGELALTTNGARLPRHAADLKAAGLTGVNVSLDALDRAVAERLARRDVLPLVLAGIDAALAAGLEVKLNAVVIRGVNDDQVRSLVAFAASRGCVMRFIEYMPMGTVRADLPDATVPAARLREILAADYDLRPDPTHDPSAPARRYVCRRTGARVGFIASVSESFCGACDRMRLTAEGSLRPCLHQNVGVDLRGRLRAGCTDDDLAAAFAEAARLKWAGHHMTADRPQFSDREMVTIGG